MSTAEALPLREQRQERLDQPPREQGRHRIADDATGEARARGQFVGVGE